MTVIRARWRHLAVRIQIATVKIPFQEYDGFERTKWILPPSKPKPVFKYTFLLM